MLTQGIAMATSSQFDARLTNNVRFNFIYRPGTDIYIVYNDLSQTGLPADTFGRKIGSW